MKNFVETYIAVETQDPNDRAKYSLRGGDSKGGNFTFTIHNVSVDDVGDITCEVNEITPKRYEIDVFSKNYFKPCFTLLPNRI